MRTKQEIQRRNYAKFKLSGITFDTSVFTEPELMEVKLIQEHIKTLLGFWDLETEEFLGHKLKPHKCNWCGKRSNKKYILVRFDFKDGVTRGLNFCRKHYLEEVERKNNKITK